jgi:tetratricopeptide (TPR) repeat protein
LALFETSDPYTPTPTGGGLPAKTLNVDELLEQGMEYYENENYQDAITLFRQVVKLESDNYEARLKLGWSYLGEELFISAKYQATECIEHYPTTDDVEAYALRALSNVHLDEYYLGLADIKKFVELAPEETWGYYYRGLIYFDLEDYNNAYNSLRLATKQQSDYGPAWGALGDVRKEQGDLINACNHWKKAVELGETDYQSDITSNNCW